jgi:sialic acid synthase SpsE
MARSIKINNKNIDHGFPDKPYLIAEIGVNHEGDLDRAKMMIKEVKDAGGDSVKFQAYKAETLASRYSPAYWDTSKEKTKSQLDLFKKYDTFKQEDYEELANYSKKLKIDFLVTPFDQNSVDFLYPLVPAYKIASADITNKPLLEYIATKGKPVLLSTGAASVSEIWRAVEWIKKSGNYQIALLHCVLNYPTLDENANLGMIKYMKKIFPDHVIGYSDHTLPDRLNDILLTAWHMGAMIIEKHYTWNKQLQGNDHYHSMDFNDLIGLKEEIDYNREILGKFEKLYLESEEKSRKYARRSLVAKKFIPKGKVIENKDITCKRPGTGIPPWMIEKIIGSTALDNLKEDQILKWDKVKLIDI